MDCASCHQATGLEPIPRWKAPLLFVGFLLFCPCHLPVTFGIIAAVGGTLTGAAWFFGNKLLVGLVFSALYILVLVGLFRWFLAKRRRDHVLEGLHEAHAAQA
jgi:membrane protein implicated in regulation of membrane protease activity